MAEKSEYRPGAPSWVDLGSPDPRASAAFYRELFGWDADEPTPETGDYTMFTRRDRLVAGLGPVGEGDPPAWTTYINVADADAVVAKVREAGGTVRMEPTDVFTAGRMANFTGPDGAFLAVWQPNEHIGAQVVNEPGTMCWHELNTWDLDAAIAFYPAVFGWTVKESTGHGMRYASLYAGDKLVGGMRSMPEGAPEQTPSLWLAYFAVENADVAANKVVELGGIIVNGPISIPEGDYYIVADAHRAVFCVIAMPAA